MPVELVDNDADWHRSLFRVVHVGLCEKKYAQENKAGAWVSRATYHWCRK